MEQRRTHATEAPEIIERYGVSTGLSTFDMKMKSSIKKAILISMAGLFLLIIIGFVALHVVVSRLGGTVRPYSDMKKDAELAIAQVGGAEVLEKEAKFALNHWESPRGHWGVLDEVGANCQAIARLSSLLTPPVGSRFWTSGEQLDGDLPAHVQVCFGVHAYYLYVCIFDPEHVPSRQIEGLEHLSGAIYLSTENR